MSLELRHLRLVVAIAEHGSIGGAARAVGIAQPAVSAQLRRIERAVGSPLFTRLPEGTRPTAAGRLVIDRAQGVIAEVDAMTRDLEELGQGTDSLVVAGPPPGVRQMSYVDEAPFLVAMGEDHPRAGQPDVALEELRDSPWRCLAVVPTAAWPPCSPPAGAPVSSPARQGGRGSPRGAVEPRAGQQLRGRPGAHVARDDVRRAGCWP